LPSSSSSALACASGSAFFAAASASRARVRYFAASLRTFSSSFSSLSTSAFGVSEVSSVVSSAVVSVVSGVSGVSSTGTSSVSGVVDSAFSDMVCRLLGMRKSPTGGPYLGLMRLGRFRKPGDLVVQLAVLNGSAEGVDLVSINALGDALPELLGREPLVPAGPVLVKHRHDLAVAPVVPTVHVGE